MVQNRAVVEAVFNVTEAIRNAADASIPKTSNSPRKLCKPWCSLSGEYGRPRPRGTRVNFEKKKKKNQKNICLVSVSVTEVHI
ncbi:hypothetical protein TNCV_274461 [Trichonephila clavipes]|nr:hypothetical protein TNCV_274461 [Trichonephila clavipes]